MDWGWRSRDSGRSDEAHELRQQKEEVEEARPGWYCDGLGKSTRPSCSTVDSARTNI